MLPNNIIIVRHGESIGNIDKTVYERTQDHLLPLTDLGIQQAISAGKSLKTIVSGTLYAYVSPYTRTRDTFKGLVQGISDSDLQIKVREEPRIREQEWGHLYTEEESDLKKSSRREYSKFFYRMDDGESGADVYDRISSFLGTLFRDFEKMDESSDVIIVTHGLTLNLFLMRWFHWSVEHFNRLKNPGNCEYVVISRDGDKYVINDSSTYGSKLKEEKIRYNVGNTVVTYI